MANYTIIGGDNKEYGPVTDADIRLWISEGRLNGESRAKGEGDAEFRGLAQFPEFAEALKPAAPGVIAPAGAAAAADDADWEANVLAREPELKLGECLAAGWSFLGANFGFLAGAVLLAWVVNFLFVFVALYVPFIGALIMLTFNGVIMGGFYLACVRRQRGESVSPAGVLSGFTGAFGQLALTGLVAGLLTQLGACCFVLPFVYLLIAWFFAVILVADKKLFFWSAMELSRKVVTRVWFEMFVLVVIAYLPFLIGQVIFTAQTGIFVMNLFDQSGRNWAQFAQAIQAHADETRSSGIRATMIGQGVFLVNLFYIAGVVARAYENLFGVKKS